MPVYACVTEQNGAQVLLAASAADGRLAPCRRWRLGSAALADGSAASELADLVGSDELIAFCADDLRAASGARPSAAARSLQARAIDLQQLAFLAWPTASGYALDELCELAGPSAPESDGAAPHRLVHLHESLVSRLAALDASLLHDLHRRLVLLRWPGAAMLQRAIGRRRAERVGPMVYAALLPERERKRSRRGPPETRLLEPDDIAGDLAPGGAVSGVHPQYEHRPGQIEMARALAAALNQDELLTVEAGSGTGKSLAYLLPAVKWAVANREKVVISTNTRSLQDQLAGKDAPLIREALHEPFAAAVAKGRSNYACLRKVMARAADAEGSLFFEDHFPVAYLLRWLTESPTGELAAISGDAISTIAGLRELIGDVRSQAESCIGFECPWRPNCPVERMRRRAENADLIIANHALVFADAASQTLPDYARLVLDEAHNVEDVATDQFGLEASRYGLTRLVQLLRGRSSASARDGSARRQLHRPITRGGVLGTVARRVEPDRGTPVVEQLEQLTDLCRAAADQVQEAVGAVGDAIAALAPRAASRSDGAPRWTLRLTEDVRQSPPWLAVRRQAERMLLAGQSTCAQLNDIAAALEELTEGPVTDPQGLRKDVQAHECQWTEQLRALEIILDSGADEHVCWLEAGEARGRPFWAMRSAPIHVGGHLAQAVYEANKTVVLTSATLTVDREFHYLRQRLGLDAHEHRLAELTVASPFDHREQLLLCIPADIPLPSEPGYFDTLCSAVADIAACAGGGTLVLFTAYTTMRAAHERLLPAMRELKLNLLCQELSGDRTELLEEFRRDRGTVLLGVKSFWEGVDVPGEALRCLVMAKLPFAVPSDPIIEARREHLERQDIDSQNTYYIPQAILGFRQGLGRLIRTRRDRGVAFVLDRRVLVRGYGRRFLNSIQRCRLVSDPLSDCLGHTESWLRPAHVDSDVPGGDRG
ncbi:MAG: helicase C-terminal domain-containing protein [Armatimonadota bacterium]|jgi:Rad3-related DNA helicase